MERRLGPVFKVFVPFAPVLAEKLNPAPHRSPSIQMRPSIRLTTLIPSNVNAGQLSPQCPFRPSVFRRDFPLVNCFTLMSCGK